MLQESYSQIVKLFIFSVSLALSAFCCGVKFTIHSQNKPEITNVYAFRDLQYFKRQKIEKILYLLNLKLCKGKQIHISNYVFL